MVEKVHSMECLSMQPESVIHDGCLFAIIIWHDFSKHGIHFFTPNELPQQVAYMRHPSGKQIQPHTHNPIARQVTNSQEVLLIKKGKLRVDFYTEDRQFFGYRILEAGDVIILIAGGHGFKVLEEVEMIEVKQGPYVGDQERTQFSQPTPELLVVFE